MAGVVTRPDALDMSDQRVPGMEMRHWRMRVTLGALLGIVVVGVAATPGAAATPDGCFGKPATITGSGRSTAPRGDDVIVGSAADDTIDGKGGNDSHLRTCRE